MSKQNASGPNNIPTMLWKDYNFHIQLLYFCNETLEGYRLLAFSKSNMITIMKKGNSSQPSNYRGITLTSIASKVYNSLLLNRMSKHLEPILRKNQNGFRKGRSILPQILPLRRIIEEVKIANRKASIAFADLFKAFDSINRSVIPTFFISMVCQTKSLQVSKLCMATKKHLFLVQMESLTLSSQLLVYFKVIHLHHTSSL